MYFCNEISHLQFVKDVFLKKLFQKINMNLFINLYVIVGFFGGCNTFRVY